MRCPTCETQNPDGARFCFNCGTALLFQCANCGTELPPKAKFCFNCGHPTGIEDAGKSGDDQKTAQPEPASTNQSGALLQRYIPQGLLAKLEAARQSGLMEGERRIVTILFCDLQGSTSAASDLDPEEWSQIVNGAFEHMIEPIYRYEGTVARLMGDGLLAFFGAPLAHEDDPQRAILAGLNMLKAMKEYGKQVRQQWGLDISIRVGINTGLVVVGAVGSDLRMEYTALGDAINLAARMEQTAEPGTVQVAEATYRLVAPLFEFKDLGGISVKGKKEPQRAYRVLNTKEDPGNLRGIIGLESPLVGRQQELAALEKAFIELKQGTGQIISITGEAGLGKSRLVAEMHHWIIADPDFNGTWVESRSLSYDTQTPYASFIGLFRDLFQLANYETDAAQVKRISDFIDDLMPNQGLEISPFFASMLGLKLEPDAAERVKYLQPPMLRRKIFSHVSSLLQQLVDHQPLIVFLDDLHWADPTSLDLLTTLLPLVNQNQLMIITAFRPRRSEPSWQFHETAERDYHFRYRAIFLEPLDIDQSQNLVANILEVEDLPETVRQAIMEKAEGNPFYVEEIIRSLIDNKQVVKEDGHWRATQDVVGIAVPDTLTGVITARLDRLDEQARQLVQSAAIIGREFSVSLLAAVADSSKSLDEAIVNLQRREIIQEKSRYPERRYIFKHALTQQAAYDSILLSNRRELHRRAAKTIENHKPDQAAEIARHWLEARKPGRAMPYLVKAGDQAASAYATGEAIDYYNQALDMHDTVDNPDVVRLAYEGLGSTLLFANQIEEAVANFQEMLALGEEMGNSSMQISANNKLAATVGLYMGQFQQAEQLLTRAESLANKNQEKPGEAEAALIRCQMCTAQADFESVIKHMNDLVEIGKELGSNEFVNEGLQHAAGSLLFLTRFEEAREKANEGLALARESGNRQREAQLLSMVMPLLALAEGDIEEAKASLTEGLSIAIKIGAVDPQIFGNWTAGEIARWQGEFGKALNYCNLSLEQALPLEEFMPWVVVPPLGSLGSAYLHISKRFQDEITRFHQHALRLLESPAGTIAGGAAWADLGHCAIQLGDYTLAEEVLQKGLNVPTMFMYLERPRLLAGQALLSLTKGNLDQALQFADQAHDYAEEIDLCYILPFTHLTRGKVLAAKGEVDASLAALNTAETMATEMEMRTVLLDALIEAAVVYDQSGHVDAARQKRDEARAVVEDIAGFFEDETLREAYLASAREKIAE
jgi:class 3 adenylate cyclase/tetratricopeptide (TPR) repeat protein